jgi:hypothetical protein
VSTVNVTKFALITTGALTFIALSLFLYLNFKGVLKIGFPGTPSTSGQLDLTGTGVETPPGLSEDENFPSEQAGIRRFQVSGTLNKAPVVNEEGQVEFEISIPPSSTEKSIRIWGMALGSQSGKPSLVLNKVTSIGEPTSFSESTRVGLNDLAGKENLREGSPIVVQFLFSDSKEEISLYYDSLLAESSTCEEECPANLKVLKNNLDKSFELFNQLLNGSDGVSASALYVVVTSIYVQN